LGTQDKLFIYGGWSYTSQFSNLWIYDIQTNEWFDPEISHDQPKWNHVGIMAPSIPSWKYFIFGGSVGSFEEGGNRTLSKVIDDTFYFDLLPQEWKTLPFEPEENGKISKPHARE
jgi:dynein heavy chain, axonemal